jgi:magnesium chelatase family protein
MLFHGPPGVGKTMLAERVPGLLPDLDLLQCFRPNWRRTA